MSKRRIRFNVAPTVHYLVALVACGALAAGRCRDGPFAGASVFAPPGETVEGIVKDNRERREASNGRPSPIHTFLARIARAIHPIDSAPRQTSWVSRKSHPKDRHSWARTGAETLSLRRPGRWSAHADIPISKAFGATRKRMCRTKTRSGTIRLLQVAHPYAGERQFMVGGPQGLDSLLNPPGALRIPPIALHACPPLALGPPSCAA